MQVVAEVVVDHVAGPHAILAHHGAAASVQVGVEGTGQDNVGAVAGGNGVDLLAIELNGQGIGTANAVTAIANGKGRAQVANSGALEALSGGIGQIFGLELIDEFQPGFVVRQGNILHHGKVQAGINAEVGSYFRIARCSFGFLVPFASQYIHHFRRGFHGGLLDRVGSLPVAAGQVGACTIDPVVQVGIRKLVGNDSAVLAGAVLVIVKALLEAVGLGGSALGSHAVGCGVTFGGQNIVQCIMGIFANGQVVIAIGQDVAACAVMGGGIIAGQQVLVHCDGDCFGSTGGQFLRFAEACQLDGGFLNAVLALVIAVRGLCVQLHNGLTGHIAGVRHGNFRGDLVLAHIHAVQLLVKRGVGQAITERVLHFIGVIPGRSAFQCANRSGSVALTHNGIGVTGLIVTVANVDAFGLEGHVLSVLILTNRGVDLGHVGKLRGTGAGVYSGR